jgi:hypothetical protein
MEAYSSLTLDDWVCIVAVDVSTAVDDNDPDTKLMLLLLGIRPDSMFPILLLTELARVGTCHI